MIHTVVLGTQLNEEMYMSIAHVLGLSHEQPEASTNNHSRRGFREIRLYNYCIQEGQKRYGIDIRLNPNVLVQGRETIHPISQMDITRLPGAFNNALVSIMRFYEIYGSLPHFNNWDCRRIDYAVDIQTQHVDIYVRLLSRCDIPSNHYTAYGEEGSQYLTSGSVTVNFYDKERQLRVRQDDEYSNVTEEVIDEVRGVLRFEVQCDSRRITYIREQRGFDNRHICNYLSMDIARDTILGYYDRTVGAGDFYSLDEAERIINDNTSLATRTKSTLIGILELVNQAISIPAAREQYISTGGVCLRRSGRVLQGSRVTFNRNIASLRKLGINPVTIPRRWRISQLSNLRGLIENQTGQ